MSLIYIHCRYSTIAAGGLPETRRSWRGWPEKKKKKGRRRMAGSKTQRSHVLWKTCQSSIFGCSGIGTRAKPCWVVLNGLAQPFKLFFTFFFVIIHCNTSLWDWVNEEIFVLRWEEVLGCRSFIIHYWMLVAK